MTKLRKSSMKEQCYEIIREKILRQEYELGQFINIVSLCGELSVSNTPIREALSQLEAEGLVVSALNSKVRVISFDQQGFLEMTQMLAILETGAYRIGCETDHLADLPERMRACLDRQAEMFRRKEEMGFLQETVSFDRCILESLGNTRLLDMFDRVAGILFLMFRTKFQQDSTSRQRSIEEHGQIIEAVGDKDHERVIRLLKQHYDKKL